MVVTMIVSKPGVYGLRIYGLFALIVYFILIFRLYGLLFYGLFAYMDHFSRDKRGPYTPSFFYKRQWKNSTSFASKKIMIFN